MSQGQMTTRDACSPVDGPRETTNRRFLYGLAAYAVPTFTIAYLWHLVVFADAYQALDIYRDELIVPFGGVAILIQGSLSAAAYPRLFGDGSLLSNGLRYGLAAGLLSWTFTTLAVAAKFPMNSIATFMLLESAFTAVQFAVVGPLTARVFRRAG